MVLLLLWEKVPVRADEGFNIFKSGQKTKYKRKNMIKNNVFSFSPDPYTSMLIEAPKLLLILIHLIWF
jgi:hypothetical protein